MILHLGSWQTVLSHLRSVWPLLLYFTTDVSLLQCCCSVDLHPPLLLCDVTKWFDIQGLKLTHLLMRLFYFPFTYKLFIHFSTCIICWTNAPGVWRPSETHWRNYKIRSSHLPITNGYSLQLLTAVDLQTFWHLSDSRHMESCPPLTKQVSSPVISWWLSKCMHFLSQDKMKNYLEKLGRHCMSTGISAVCFMFYVLCLFYFK